MRIHRNLQRSRNTFVFWKASTEAYKSAPIDYGVVLLDGVEKSKIWGDKDWCQVVIEIAETNTHTVIWRYVKDDADAMGEDCIWVDELAWIPIDPIPELGVDATSAEVEDALNGSVDTKLAENIKDGATYGQYREWANNVSENVDITFGTPENGKVKFTAGPNAKNADAKAFFMKVKMTP